MMSTNWNTKTNIRSAREVLKMNIVQLTKTQKGPWYLKSQVMQTITICAVGAV